MALDETVRLWYYTNSTFEAVFITQASDQTVAYQRIAERVRDEYINIEPVEVKEWEVTELKLPPEPEVRMIRTWE